MTNEEAISYVGGLTRYVFEKEALSRIACKRQVAVYGCACEVPEEVEDYCLMDLYKMVVTGPYSVAPSSLQHGNFRQDVGSETITSAMLKMVKAELKRLYKKYGLEDDAETIETGETRWVNDWEDCW